MIFITSSLWILLQLMLIGLLQAGNAIYSLSDRSARQNEFPYVVQIIDSDDSFETRCSGAIIDAKHILTAAHCVFRSSKNRITIAAGELYRSDVERIHVPKEFSDDGYRCGIWNHIRSRFRDFCEYVKYGRHYSVYQYDIAVLTLSEALPFDENIKAVNLPNSDDLPYCEILKFAGWGQTEIDGPISKNLLWTYLMISESPGNKSEFSSAFWAIDPILETCPLEGDSGAPLVFNNTVYGVHSAGERDPSIPSVFCKVFSHINFIKEALEN